MVRTSGIREKLRSSILNDLARERNPKRTREKLEEENKDEEEEDNDESDRQTAKAQSKNHSLLSILPKPKHANVFGPSIRVDELLKLPERADQGLLRNTGAGSEETSATRLSEDGMIEIDVSKVVNDDVSHTLIKDLTIEKSNSNPVVVPKGKEKQKNQITYLAQLGKAMELDRKEKAAQSRLNKAAARSKYGW